MKSIFSKVLYELEKNHNLMLLTIVEDSGSAPRGAGAMMLAGENGPIVGTIGGGPSEVDAVERAKVLIKEKQSYVHDYRLHKNDIEDVGAVCGGDIKVVLTFIDSSIPIWKEIAGKICDMIEAGQNGYLAIRADGKLPSLLDAKRHALVGDELDEREKVYNFPLPVGERVFLFGAGHCAKALVPVLSSVGFRVTVYDDRDYCVTKENYPNADRLICESFEKAGKILDVGGRDYVVIMTAGHSFDYVVELQMIQKKPLYLGMIGSRKKLAHVNEKLKNDGIFEEDIKSVHSPIGLSIGAITPEEIAVSIAAEIIEVRANDRKNNDRNAEAYCPV